MAPDHSMTRPMCLTIQPEARLLYAVVSDTMAVGFGLLPLAGVAVALFGRAGERSILMAAVMLALWLVLGSEALRHVGAVSFSADGMVRVAGDTVRVCYGEEVRHESRTSGVVKLWRVGRSIRGYSPWYPVQVEEGNGRPHI